MGAKIQADEISSIIKERIDNFELNVDETDLKKILIVGAGAIGCAMVADHRAREAIHEMGYQLIIGEIPTKTEVKYMPCYLQNAMKVFVEPVLQNLPDKSWYRKFERKSKRIK